MKAVDPFEYIESERGFAFAPFFAAAKEIDGTVDKLYDQIYIYNDECQAIPYDPKSRKRFVSAFSEICQVLSDGVHVERSIEDEVLAELFFSILDKLQEITGLYLLGTTRPGTSGIPIKVYTEQPDG